MSSEPKEEEEAGEDKALLDAVGAEAGVEDLERRKWNTMAGMVIE